MKALTILLLATIANGARGYLIKVPTSPVVEPGIAPLGWVHIQKLILPLFSNVCEESKNPIVVRLSQDFKQNMTNGNYLRPDVITSLQALLTGKGILAKGEIFTEYNIDHANELKIIYDVFYNAKDFDTFYKAACWARQNVNCGLFVDALYMAILNRRDSEKLIVLAPYEILPNYFIRKDFIIKASTLIAGEEVTSSDSVRNDGNAYILDVNYTTSVYDSTDEAKLAYFHEDIGLNSYYYLTKLKTSTWFNKPKSNGYGEYLYLLMKQLMARYNLERYSNDLPELEGINWNTLDVVPYDPMLVYSNGNDFTPRTFVQIESNEKLTLLQNIENNIVTVVTHMRESGYNKSEILNHLMEILMTSDKSYINLALQVLSEDNITNNRPPSVLEHYMTTLRDPIFWVINKKVVDLVDNALKVLPVYTKNELYFPGVEVINIDVKKMMTSFDNFDFDVTEALETVDADTKFEVKISQTRLNHKPFSIKVNISSLVSQKGLVKIYLGPKILPGEHALKKNLFMLLDTFETSLKIGSNIITRTSADMVDNSDDFLSLGTIRRKIADAEFGLGSIAMKSVDSQIRFPSRLIIPKGKPEGLPLQVFVFIVPFMKSTGGKLVNTEFNTDALLSPGYPLDLDVDVRELFNLPNALVKDIIVTHKGNDGKTSNYGGYVPGKRPWQNNDYDNPTDSEPLALALAARPEFTKQGSFDYKSKRGQYGKKEDYTAKRGDYKKKDYITPIRNVDIPGVTNYDNKVKTESTTDNFVIYGLYDITQTNKDNTEYTINTDMSFDGGNTFLLDKTIFDKGKDEEVHIDVTRDSNTKIVPEDIFTKNTHEIINKIVDKKIDKKVGENFQVKPETTTDNFIMYDPYHKTSANKDNIEYIVNIDTNFDGGNTLLRDKTIFGQGKNEEFHMEVTKDSNSKIIPDDNMLIKDTNEIIKKTVDKKIDNQEDLTPGYWPSSTKKRSSTIYDIIVNPYNIFNSDERVYE